MRFILYTCVKCSCNFYADVDECSTLGVDACENAGTCLNQNGSYSCICVTGYTGVHCDSGKQRTAMTVVMDLSNLTFIIFQCLCTLC